MVSGGTNELRLYELTWFGLMGEFIRTPTVFRFVGNDVFIYRTSSESGKPGGPFDTASLRLSVQAFSEAVLVVVKDGGGVTMKVHFERQGGFLFKKRINDHWEFDLEIHHWPPDWEGARSMLEQFVAVVSVRLGRIWKPKVTALPWDTDPTTMARLLAWCELTKKGGCS